MIAAAAAVLSLCVALWARQADLTDRVAFHLALFGAAFAAYLLALHRVPTLSARGLRLALLLAAGWRIALLASPPLLSDDVYRYVWEGRISLRGGNPYAWADRPEADRWAPLRDDIWERMNHRSYTAVYPPAWQLAGAAVVAVHDSVAAMKAFLVLCDVATWPLLLGLLRRRGQPPGRVLVQAWSPLALVEVAGSGHNDAFGMLLTTGALALLEAGRPALSAGAAALAVQAKLLPALIVAAWARRYRPLHALLAGGVAAALVVPYLGAGAGLWDSLDKYSQHWLFNETGFALLLWALGRRGAVLAAALLVGGLALALAWRRTDAAAAGLLVAAAWLLLAPSVLPWYALWLLPFLVLCDAPGALLFTGTVQLAYLVYPDYRSGEPWQVGWEWRALQVLPCLAVAAWSRRRG